MAGYTNAVEQETVDDFFGGVARTLNGTHIGYFTTLPNEAGAGGVEPAVGGYARQAFARNQTNWPAATGADPVDIDNGVAVTFPKATASQGTIVGWGYFTAVSAGSVVFWAPLDTSKAIDTDDTPEFAIGGLVAKIGDPGDTF